MKVVVKARHMDLTPAIRAHAEQKIMDALRRVFDRPAAAVEIELSDLGRNVRDGSKECRISVTVPRGRTITICEYHDNLYTAINLAHDRVLTQVKRQRGRMRKTRRGRQWAAQNREETMRETLTAAPEAWEAELQEFESAQAI